MKDLHKRLKRLYLRRTVDFAFDDVPVKKPTNAIILHPGQGPIFMSDSSICKDGSLIACALPSSLYCISYEKGTYTFTEVSTGNGSVIGGLIHVGNECAISVGTRGKISSIFYGELTHIETTRWSFYIASHVSISNKEFVGGDTTGCLRFFEHNEGRNIRKTRTVRGVHTDFVSRLVVHDNIMVAVSYCRRASVWDLKCRRQVALLPHSEIPIDASINKHHIVTMSWFEVRVFRNEPEFRLRHVFKGLNGFRRNLCVLIAGDNLLLTAGNGSMITATNIDRKLPIARFTTSLPDVTYLSLLPDGHIIAACYPFISRTSSDVSDDYSENDYCAVLKLSQSNYVHNELRKEARSRFGSPSNRKNWLLSYYDCNGRCNISVATNKLANSKTSHS